MKFATRVFVLVISCVALLSTPLRAQETCSWIGNTDVWELASNWTCTGTPTGGATGIPDISGDNASILTAVTANPRISSTITVSNLNFSLPLTVDTGGLLSVDVNYSQTADLLGAGRVNILATGTWLSGSQLGSGQTFIGNAASFTVNSGGPALTINQRLFRVAGPVNVNSTVTLDGGALIDILGGAPPVVSFINDVDILPAGTGGTITNAGNLQKTGGTGTSHVGVPYTSTSTGFTKSTSGKLEFTGGGTLAGNIRTDPGTVAFTVGTYNWSFANAAGAGSLFIDGATINYANASNSLAVENLDFTSGTMTSDGPTKLVTQTILTVSSFFIWRGGTLAGSGSFVDVFGGAFFITGPRTLSGQKLTTKCCQTHFWASGDFVLSNGSEIVNEFTTWNVTNSGAFTSLGPGSKKFRNNGSFTRGAPGTTTVGSGVEFINGGSVNVAGDFTMAPGGIYTHGSFANIVLQGGNFNHTGAPLQIFGGRIEGSGTVNANLEVGGPVDNGAAILPGSSFNAGTIMVNGTYTQSQFGSLVNDVFGTTPGTQYDQLLVSGAATISGNLNTNRTGFTPTAADPPYDILVSSVSRTGTFTATFTPGFSVDYSSPTKVVLLAAPGPDLNIGISDNPDPVQAGLQLNINVNLSNVGTADATVNTPFTIDLPDNAPINNFGAFNANCTNNSPASPELDCTTTTLLLANQANSAGVSITLDTPPGGGVLSTTATASAGPDPDPNLANNTATETTTVVPALNLTVTTTNDEIDLTPGDGVCNSASGCSLRAAIEESNRSFTFDTINLPAGTYVLTLTGPSEDLNQTGDLDVNDGVDIIGASAKTSIIDGASNDRVFDFFTQFSCGNTGINLKNVTVQSGLAPSGETGGGIRVRDEARAQISYAQIANNMAPDGGGGISAMYSGGCGLRREPNPPDRARRLKPTEDARIFALVQITNSSFVGNSASGGSGGGLLVASGGRVSTENTTFAQNSAGVNGGAVAIPNLFDDYIGDFTTFSENTAPTGGGIYAGSSAFPNVYQSVFANNPGGNCAGPGGFTSGNYNLSDDLTCGFAGTGDQNGIPAMLAPLTNLGSQTSYYGLLTGSPAIDTGDPAVTAGFDQRNLPKPRDGNGDASVIVDIGAIETQPEANLSIGKSGPASVAAGGMVTYTISVINGGPNDTMATVNDVISSGTFVSGTAPCTGGFPCSFPIALGQTIMFDATFMIPSNASGNLTNTATVASSAVDFDPSNNTAMTIATITAQADLSVSKTGPSFITAGQNVTYTTTVTNGGPSDATNVIVSDPTPAGLTFVSNAGACTSAFPCNAGTIVSSGNASIMSTYLVSPSATGMITNTASATSDAADPNTANNTGTITSSVIATGDLSIVKNGPTSVIAGQNITYTIDVNNPGPSDATGVMVADPTPPGTTFVSNTGACTTAFPCNLGALPASQTASITATFSVSPAATGSIVNSATVSSTSGDTNTANNTATSTATVVSQADVSITKSGPATASEGDTIVFTVTVSNAGPASAANVMVTDPTPGGLTFVSNSGACTTAYPCAIGTLNAGQSATIQSTYNVNAGSAGSITNTASVSTTSPESSTTNNSSSTTVQVAGCPTAPPDLLFPADGAQGVALNGTLTWSNTGATQYNLFFGPTGSGCSSLVFSGSSTSQQYFNLTPGQQYEWRVEGARPGCVTLSSACAHFTAMTVATCPTAGPTPISPLSGTVSSPVTFTWTAVDGAVSYTVTANGANVGTTSDTTLTANVGNGPLTWFVTATVPGCSPLQSRSVVLNICNIPPAPIPSLVGEAATGQNYTVQWSVVNEAIRYQLQESLDANFASINDMFEVTGNSRSFEKNINPPQAFYYRVRAIGSCGELPGPFSEIVRIVIVPIPANPNVSIPAGSTEVILQTLIVPGDEGITYTFTATTDKPWLRVRPMSGTLGPAPATVTLEILADPTTLTQGTFTGTVILDLIEVTSARNGRLETTASTKKQIPVSVSLVTPVTPQQRTSPTNDSLIIATVGHLDGIGSSFRSDVRIANAGFSKQRYQITFNQSGQDPGKPVKQTVVDIDAQGQIALDDIVKNFYGIGGLGDQAAGFLEIRPFGGTGALSPQVDQAGVPGASRVTVASSRTYAVGANGTLGQFIPALSFTSFISKAGGAFAKALSIQQIAQNASFRSNIGVVEASGTPVSVLLSIFSSAGNKLLDIPVDLKGGELKQLNSLLSTNNITLDNGRIEARVTAGDGRVTAYASVIDNSVNDPLLVSGVPLGQLRARKYIFAGAGALTSAAGRFRTDMRVFNNEASPQTATLTFYPQGGQPTTKQVTFNSGEVAILDNVVETLFGVQGAGAVHVETPTDAELIVTGRTYAETSRGRLGQFIEASTVDQAVGRGDRALNILQVEDSVRYRTNIGLAEVTGKPAMVEVLVILPDSKVVPRVQLQMGANEFRQFALIRELGLGNVYNARVTVRVMDGEGKVTAYGSVLDETSQDPTYIKAQ